MIDLNDAAPQRSPGDRYDLDAIVARLRETAGHWVPQHFPNGRREGDEWRLANIRGDAPRKQGSCVIALTGDRAGDWHDFDGGHGGDPLGALAQATGLAGRDLFAHAAGIGGVHASPASPAGKRPVRQSADDAAREIAFVLSGTRPIAGTHAERYLAARGLALPASVDLLFHDDLAHREAKRGYPGVVAIVRDAGGTQVALHRTYLDPAGPAKADVAPARKTLGPVGGGAVHLAEPRDGLVGLAEGIETALAAMTACPDLPVWATLSTAGMESVQLPADIVRVVLLADHDDAGRRAAAAAASRLAGEGRNVRLALPPREGDDFNDLLRREGPAAVRAAVDAAAPWSGAGAVPAGADGTPRPEPDVVAGTAPPEPDEVARVEAAYPLPPVESMELRYFRTRRGEVLVHRNAGKDKDGRALWRAVASPFGIPARLRYLDHDSAYGLRLLVRDMQGEPRAVDLPRAGLARQGAQDARAALYAAGLRTYGDGDQVAISVFKAANPDEEILVVSRPGWHRIDGCDHPVFVTPSGRA
ncbi:MAG: toprim domain-containing protein, partial [Vicinamibacterales bacterium]